MEVTTSWRLGPLLSVVFTLPYPLQLTAFGGFLKYTVSYTIPVEMMDSDLMFHDDVIIKVIAFTLLCIRDVGLSLGTFL